MITKIAPVNTALVQTTTNDISGFIECANGIANGINILIVPYAVPVENEITAPKINIKLGNKNAGIALLIPQLSNMQFQVL